MSGERSPDGIVRLPLDRQRRNGHRKMRRIDGLDTLGTSLGFDSDEKAHRDEGILPSTPGAVYNVSVFVMYRPMNPMEQPPKGMPVEQLPLDFGEQETLAPEVTEVTLESLPDAELHVLYKKRVGVDPKIRGFDRAVVLAGLADPEAEKDRISALEMAEDQELRRLGRQHL